MSEHDPARGAESGSVSAEEILAKVREAGLETVRLVTVDPHGSPRGKTVVAGKLGSVLSGELMAPSTLLLKDTSQRTAFDVWSEDAGFGPGVWTGAGDVHLVPDLSTFQILPWSPTTGWMLCDTTDGEGGPFPFGSRDVLRRAVSHLEGLGFAMSVGLEVEFHVFRAEDREIPHGETGFPGAPPRTSATTRSYDLLGEDRYDALEAIIDPIRRACDAVGLPVRSVEPEFGPSQMEFVFDPGSPMEQADRMVLFRSLVKQVCRRNGYHATFMCRPGVPNAAASGWHIHQSLTDLKTGRNALMPDEGKSLNPTASGWIAGLLKYARESSLLTTPTVNGYKRYQAFQLAPVQVHWGMDNKGAMLRGLMTAGNGASRIENRVPEPAANPYFAIASQMFGGAAGLEEGLTAPPPTETPYASGGETLPGSLLEAIQAFEAGTLYSARLGEGFVRYLSRLKRAEWDRYSNTVTDWEQREYFSLF